MSKMCHEIGSSKGFSRLLDYKVAKANYFQLVAESKIHKADRKYYSNVTRLLMEVESGVPPTVAHAQFVKKYELLEDKAGHQYLVKKRESPGSPIRRLLPLEDSFDVLHTVHVSNNHAGRDRMRHILNQKYCFRFEYINMYIQSCPVCKEKKGKKEKIDVAPQSTAHAESNAAHAESNANRIIETSPIVKPVKVKKASLDIIDLSNQPDGNFKMLFVYTDMRTAFVILRPLISKCDFEVSSELVKILTSFGPPKVFAVFNRDEQFFRKVLSNLQRFGLHIKIPMKKHYKKHNDYIHGYLKMWMDKEGPNWGIGCHSIQYNLNNDKVHENIIEVRNDEFHLLPTETPHIRLFGTMPYSYAVKNNSSSDSDNEALELLAENAQNTIQQIASELDSVATSTSSSTKVRTRLCTELNIESAETKNKDNPIMENVVLVANKRNMITKVVPRISCNIVCHVCERKIQTCKPYTCNICHKPVHFFCTELSGSTYLCFHCGDKIKL